MLPIFALKFAQPSARRRKSSRPTGLPASGPHRALRWHALKLCLLLLLAGGAAGCATVPTLEPPSTAGRTDASQTAQPADAVQLLDAAVAAHGGDAYERFDNITVSYDGRWGRLIPRIQPVVVDIGYRQRSQEQLWLTEDRLLQRFDGPEGVKTVDRDGDGAVVHYFPSTGGDDAARTGTDAETAAAFMVADAYEMFLLGPSFLKRHATRMQRLPPETLQGRSYDRLLLYIEPGLGPGGEDRVMAWFDRTDRRLFRIRFTIDGLPSTRGAAVDVTFHDYQEFHGAWWATRYVERVRAPFRVFAHRWSLTGIDVDRPQAPNDRSVEHVLGLIDRPAKPLAPTVAGRASPSSIAAGQRR